MEFAWPAARRRPAWAVVWPRAWQWPSPAGLIAMDSFLGHLRHFAWPYRGRMALGVACGVLAGFAEPLLLLTIVMVFKVVFPYAQDTALEQQLTRFFAFAQNVVGHVKGWWPALAGWLQAMVQSLQTWSTSRTGPGSTGGLILLVGAIPAVMLVRGVLTYLNSYLINWSAARAVSDLRTRLFTHLINQPMSFFTSHSTGELISRAGDISVLHTIFSVALPVITKEPFTVVTYVFVLFSLQPGLSLVALLGLPLCLVPVVVYAGKIRKSSAGIQNQYAELSQLMHESFSGNRIIKAYNMESAMVDLFRQATRKFISHCMRVVRSLEIPGPMIEVVGALGVAGMFIFVARVEKNPNPANFLGFVISLIGLYRPLKSLTRLHGQFVQAKSASTRVFQLLATSNTMPEPAQPKPIQAAGSEIRFENLQFAYADKVVLRDFNLTVSPGQMVALVGTSGSGKTTVANLLLRFYDPQQGRILIGGTDIREVSARDLRGQIALVSQETILFNETISYNISLGRPGASREEIEAAAKHALAHEFILNKEARYETVIGERGGSLSGGQRQRLAIARAILKNAPILILDEATSMLDTESERAVQAALEDLMTGRTTICIAHRLSTIQKADVIVVMSEGCIIEMGRHADLIQQNGSYRKLHDLQFQTV